MPVAHMSARGEAGVGAGEARWAGGRENSWAEKEPSPGHRLPFPFSIFFLFPFYFLFQFQIKLKFEF